MMDSITISIKDYSSIMRALGIIWGAADTMEGTRASTVILDAIELIDNVLDKGKINDMTDKKKRVYYWTHDLGDEDHWRCEKCGEEPWWCGVEKEILPPFCPNCGAKMEVEGA